MSDTVFRFGEDGRMYVHGQEVVLAPDPDLGAEDWEFPSFEDVHPAERPSAIGRLWYEIEVAATEANKRAERLKHRKAAAKQMALTAIEESPYPSVSIIAPDGREVRLKPYEFTAYTVKDQEAFDAWAATQRERFYDPTPSWREGVFLDHMRHLDQTGQPLPPGVIRYAEPRISRSAVAKR